jgi:nucleoside-diphosphate-sugar epimerase
MPTALITGITGQDGSFLAELLLRKGYEVHGIVRHASTDHCERIAHLTGRVRLHPADLLDQGSLIEVLREADPDEVYNLAAMRFVPTSWKQPVLTGEFTALGVTRMLEAIRLLNPDGIRFYQASSSRAAAGGGGSPGGLRSRGAVVPGAGGRLEGQPDRDPLAVRRGPALGGPAAHPVHGDGSGLWRRGPRAGPG